MVESEIVVGDSDFAILRVQDTNVLLDRIDAARFAIDERLPYWADLWLSSIALARYCLEESHMRGTNVLELGCGLGLAGIAAAKAGAVVTQTDYELDALQFCRYNAMRNLSDDQGASQVVHLDWRNPEPIGVFDVIIASDIIYERKNFHAILTTLIQLLHPEGCAVLTDPGRSTAEDFLSTATEYDYAIATTSQDVKMGAKTGVIRQHILSRSRG